MTNLDSVLRSRYIILPTKMHIVRAMAFPVAMYECESWTIKKAESQRCFWIVVLKKTLESPLDCEEINSECSLERLMLKRKLQYFGHLMQRANSLEKTLMLGKIKGRRTGQQRMRQVDSITDSMDMSLSKLRKIVKDRGAWCATVHGVAKSQTELSNWTTTRPNWHVSCGPGRQECSVTQSCTTVCSPRLFCPWDFPVKNTGTDCHFLLQGIFLTQGLNPSLASPALTGGFFLTSTT